MSSPILYENFIKQEKTMSPELEVMSENIQNSRIRSPKKIATGKVKPQGNVVIPAKKSIRNSKRVYVKNFMKQNARDNTPQSPALIKTGNGLIHWVAAQLNN